jgi:FlaA1/EpsC-like NDP-sugar epimerase
MAVAAVQGRRVLVTGAGGSIGSYFVCGSVAAKPESLILLDSSEHALYEIQLQVSRKRPEAATRIVPIVGSFFDESLLESLLRQHQPDLILHAGAYKHVPLMEQNPLAAMANNAVGTYKLVLAALQNDVSQIVMVSTDKAVNPRSVMGASKRIAELVLLSHATAEVRMNSVRLGNVLGSSGSVVPLFEEQLANGSPITVTQAEARRFFMTASEALATLLTAATCRLSGKILLAGCSSALRVLDLAFFLAEKAGLKEDPLIEFTGLRFGEKLEEELLMSEETVEATWSNGMRIVSSPCPSASELAFALEKMDAAIRRGNIRDVMACVAELVPEYQPATSSRLTAEVE